MSEDLMQHAIAQGPLREPSERGAMSARAHAASASQSHAVSAPVSLYTGAAGSVQGSGPSFHTGVERAGVRHDGAERTSTLPDGAGDASRAASTASAKADGAGDSDAQDAPWYDALADESLRRWAQAKGWKDPLAAVESNYHLERLLGADRAGRLVALPGENATQEELRAFRSKMGVPASAADYDIPVPEGAPSDFARTCAQWLHDAGVPTKSARELALRWNEHLAQSQVQAQTQAREQAALARTREKAASEAQVEELKAEWGARFDANADYARRAAVAFIPAADAKERDQVMHQVERAMGTGRFMRFMAKIGRGLSEHLMVSSGDAGGGGVYSPQAARERIAALRADKAWTAAYVGGDAAKAAEMSRLHRAAFTGEGA